MLSIIAYLIDHYLAVDSRTLTEVLNVERRNAQQLQDLTKGQAKLETTIEGQHGQLDTIIQKLDSAKFLKPVETTTKDKGKKQTIEFYQVTISCYLYWTK